MNIFVIDLKLHRKKYILTPTEFVKKRNEYFPQRYLLAALIIYTFLMVKFVSLDATVVTNSYFFNVRSKLSAVA